MLSNLNMAEVFDHYERRRRTHIQLLADFNAQNINDYVNLALGISSPEGNYSASEHQLGPRVLQHHSPNAIYDLATELFNLRNATHLPNTVYDHNLAYLRISLGSEIATMLDPDRFWVGNVRTLYSHLLIKHNQNKARALEELELYKDPDGIRPSEMEYKVWRDLYSAIESSLLQIAQLGVLEAHNQHSQAGHHEYLWADAICSYLYEDRT